MSSLFLALSLTLVFSLSLAVCITVNINVKWYNLIIGSLILYFCFLFSHFLSANIFYVVVVGVFACLYNSFFYTNYIISSKNLLIFFIYLSYILFIEGIKAECYALMGINNKDLLNIFIILISIVLLLVISITLRFCIRKVKLSSYIYHARVVFDNFAVSLDLFLDSGNFLKYEAKNLPVVIVNKNKLKKLNLLELDDAFVCGISGNDSKAKIVLPKHFEISIKGRWTKKEVAIYIVEREFVFYDGLIGLGIIN
ncbi:MAG: sigma-E processing peptidase SpoIIGA [Clostridia bacterium]|nr:sigma-E processing peptidase SpoIIGA [Clostridia bacterium]